MRVAAAAADAYRLEDVIEQAADAALEVIEAASLSISRWERDQEAMRTLINVGVLGPGEDRFPTDELYPLAEHPLVAELLREKRPYHTAVDDPDASPRAVEILRRLDKESDLAVPIVVDGEVWGEVWATTHRGTRRFDGGDVRFLEAIAAQLALVLRRAERYTRVSQLAYEDPLTGLANRRAIEERLESLLSEADRSLDGVMTLMLCDVDGLKAINDGQGHEAGDEVLRRVGMALVTASAPVGAVLVGRLAGDEFCVLLEGVCLDEAAGVANATLDLLSEGYLPVSVSFGAAVAAPGAATGEVLSAADAGQYAAKRRGGGMLCTADVEAQRSTEVRLRLPRHRELDPQLEATASALLRLLDGEMAGRSGLDRLEAVTVGFAMALDASAWAISQWRSGSRTLRLVSTADDRDHRWRGARIGVERETYDLDQYPDTARIVERGCGGFLVRADDDHADPAERRLLLEMGFTAALVHAVAHEDCVYLVEIYADERTVEMDTASTRLELLLRAAAQPGRLHGRGGELERRTRELEAAGALGARLAGLTDIASITDAAVDELGERLGFTLCSILRLNQREVEIVAARGVGAVELMDRDGRRSATVGLVGRALGERRVVISDDMAIPPDYRATSGTAHINSELCVPIWVSGRLWGAIDLEDASEHAFDDADARLLTTVADQVGSALHSAELFEQVEQAYLDTARAFSTALYVKDAYTASHSASIVQNAEATGRLMGLEEQELRTLRYGAVLHDIGKLAIPAAILTKGSALTAEERGEMERHTLIGEQILAPIRFLSDVLPLIRHGHERWDGTGYPDRLVGEEIPLGARIIFACDAYDAIITDRPYRAGRSPEKARVELRRCAGRQFDPAVVDALIEVLQGQPLPAS